MDFDELDEANDEFNSYNDDTSIDVDSDDSYINDETTDSIDEVDFDIDGFGENTEKSLPLDNNSGNIANTNAKKAAGIAIIVGLVIIIACFGISALTKSIKNKGKSTGEEIQATKTTSEYNEYNFKNDKKENYNQSESSDWVRISVDEDMKFNALKDSEFTVINISHFAKIVNENGDKVVKSTIKGYISGLIGTYEVDIPYDKAKYIKEGTILKVEYSYTMRDDNIILNEINFR